MGMTDEKILLEFASTYGDFGTNKQSKIYEDVMLKFAKFYHAKKQREFLGGVVNQREQLINFLQFLSEQKALTNGSTILVERFLEIS